MLNDTAQKQIVIQNVRDLIADPAHWTQGVLAKSAKNRPVAPTSKRAVCWCLMGAFERVAIRDAYEDDVVFDAENGLREYFWRHGAKRILLSCLNDTLTHAEIIQGLDAYLEEIKRESC